MAFAVDECRGVAVRRWHLTSDAPVTSKPTWVSVLKAMFLPEGYPKSVSSDYLAFQAWDTTQALCSYIRGLLSSQAILRGVGVGQQAATPLAAVFQFFLRDLTGMLGGIGFAFWQGSGFDACAKQWRLFADVTNDIGMAVELASPFFPGAFLAMACFGSIARSVTGVAGGATRAALTQHFAKQGNAADIAAKEQSQETATTMIGMVVGMAFTHATSEHATAAWLLFVVLTIVHIWANVRAMRCLVLTSLNQPRLDLLLRVWMDQGKVLTPHEMADEEDLTPTPIRLLLDKISVWRDRPARLVLGTHMQDLAAGGMSTQELCQLVKQPCSQERYLVVAQGGAVKVLLHSSAQPANQLRAYLHGRHLSVMLSTSTQLQGQLDKEMQQLTSNWMTQHCSKFVAALQAAGWQLERLSLPKPMWTVQWDVSDKHTE